MIKLIDILKELKVNDPSINPYERLIGKKVDIFYTDGDILSDEIEFVDVNVGIIETKQGVNVRIGIQGLEDLINKKQWNRDIPRNTFAIKKIEIINNK
jgi:hypothetical protein